MITKYICEVCHRWFNSKKDALECEAKRPPEYPVGMIFGNHEKGNIYSHITFAIGKISYCFHYNDSPLWACREHLAGDSLGDELCGGGNFHNLNEDDAKLDVNHKTFKRLVKWLKSQDIPITVWDGTKPVPLDEYLHTKKRGRIIDEEAGWDKRDL